MLSLSSLGLNSTSPLVVGVSGGADSLALLSLLRRTGYPLLVCHFNHRLRPSADSESARVAALAEAWNLPFVTDSAPVAEIATQNGFSLEESARKLRYRFLFSAARAHAAQAVLVAHTADDQAETVLMHFLRGAGLDGLKGMTPRTLLPEFDPRIPLVRPLLGLTRAETESICRTHGLDFVVDESNRDPAYLRNRLRHELLPALEAYNPQIRRALAKTALALQGDAELLAGQVDAAWKESVCAQGPGFVAFERARLAAAHPALRRNLLRQAALTLRPGLRDVGFEALQRAASLRAVDVAGGLRTLPEGDLLYLFADVRDLPSPWPQLFAPLEFTGGVQGLGGGWRLQGELLAPPPWPVPENPLTAWLDADLTGDRLRLRLPRRGDRFEPLGMPGRSVKLSDVMINLKIPQRLRAAWPLVCAEDGAIAWMGALRLAEGYKLTPRTRRAWRLELRSDGF